MSLLTIEIALNPIIVAYLCPSCYQLEKVSKNIYVEKRASNAEKAAVVLSAKFAQAEVNKFFHTSFDTPSQDIPVTLVCLTKACDKRLGGKGSKATAYGYSFVRVSPSGANRTILTHEFSHIEIHRRLGLWHLWQGVLPSWFDEGLAVLISNDKRYIKTGTYPLYPSTPVAWSKRCITEPKSSLPKTGREWIAQVKKDMRDKLPDHEGVYAQSACKVLHWLDKNGGRAGFLKALQNVINGKRAFP